MAEATAADVDKAVLAAKSAFSNVWGFNTPGTKRAQLLNTLADLMEERHNEFAAIEALDNGVCRGLKSWLMFMWFSTGKAYSRARDTDIPASIATIRYFAGWADKIIGQVLEVSSPIHCASDCLTLQV